MEVEFCKNISGWKMVKDSISIYINSNEIITLWRNIDYTDIGSCLEREYGDLITKGGASYIIKEVLTFIN